MKRDYCFDRLIMAIYAAAPAAVEDTMHWETSGAYDEDECTVQFGVEDDDVQRHLGIGISAGGVIFREYGGEDFSMYLDDDEDKIPTVPPAVNGSGTVEEPNKISTHRYKKRQNRSKPEEAKTIGAFDQVQSLADSGSTPGPRNTLDGLRERLVQFLPGSNRTHRYKSREGNKIQKYSFADLRIGSSLLSEQQRFSPGSSIAGSSATNSTAAQHESESGSEIRSSISLETRSDLGFSERGSSWWNLNTLSDRQVSGVGESNGRQKTRNHKTSRFQRRADSVPDLLDSREAEGRPSGRLSPDGGSTGVSVSQRRQVGDGGLVNCWDENVRRQAEQSTPQKTVPERSIWKRLAHTINKRTRMSKGCDVKTQQQRHPANELRPTLAQEQRPPANAQRPPPTPPPDSAATGDIYDEIRL